MFRRIKRFASHVRLYAKLRGAYRISSRIRVPWSVIARDLRPWRASLQPGRSPVEDRVPWITFGAHRHLLQTLPSHARVFEYGSGGSTLFFLDRGYEVTTVEHDEEWLERVRGRVAADGRWVARHEPPSLADAADSGYLSGFPGYDGMSFRRYVNVLGDFPPGHFDIVMVDGRARAACLALASRLVATDGVVILDNSERPRYASAVNAMVDDGWRPSHFHGPSPYVMTEFSNTTVFRRSRFGPGTPLSPATVSTSVSSSTGSSLGKDQAGGYLLTHM